MPKSDSPGRTVLITRFSALGDVALSVPPVYDACRRCPGVRFVMLSRKHPASLFINPPQNLIVEGIDTTQYEGATGLWRLWRSLNAKYHFTDMVDLHDVLRTKILRSYARLSGVRVVTFNKERLKKKALTRSSAKVLVPLTSTSWRYSLALDKAGFGGTPEFHSIFSKAPDPELFGIVTPPRQEGEYWLAVAPFARHKGKIYPLNLMEKVVKHFASRPGYKVFVFGFGADESQTIAKWAEGFPALINMAHANIGLGAELALLSYCDTMLSMDSANMHLASLVGLRTVSVWGATHPFTGFMGYGQQDSDAVQLDMTCRPCSVFGNKPCHRGDYYCLAGISPKLIIDRIDRK